jgi:hypothetical protein
MMAVHRETARSPPGEERIPTPHSDVREGAMMHDLFLEHYAKEKHEEALRAAAQDRLAQLVEHSQPRKPTVLQRLALTLGSLLVRWGGALQGAPSASEAAGGSEAALAALTGGQTAGGAAVMPC